MQTQTAYDPRGNAIRHTDALGHITRSDYNAAGDLIKQTSPLGLITRHSYNARGEKEKTEHPDGLIDSWSHDAEGREIQSCTAASPGNPGLCEQTRYDALGRAIETVDAAGGISRNQYDAAGQLTESQDALGRKTRYEYDAAGRIVKTTDPLGHSQRTAYSEAGQIASITAADGKQTAYDYDSAGRKVRTRWPGGAVSSAAWDAAGQKTADTDETGHSQRYAYDSAARLIQTTQPSGAATRYEWNEAGQLLSQTDALGRTTHYGYDLGGRRTSRRLPDGSQEKLTHDADGNLTAQQQLDGTQISYSYSQGRATGQTRPDGTLQIGYDAHGRANSWSDSQRGQVKQTLDALGRQTGETSPHGQSDTAWDAASQRLELKANFAGQGEHSLSARWDAGGRLQSLASGQGSAQFSHDAAGRLIQIKRANGASSHYSYDAAGRLAQIRHQKADGSALAQYSYQRDAKGRLTRATEETGGQITNKSWEYDADGKLTQESTSAAGITRTCRYSHDSTGNRTEKDCDGQKTSYVYNLLDQLTEEQTATGKTTYRWDGRGNLIEKQTPAQTIRYTWSSDNRLMQASDGSTTVSYGYDALGRRISRTREAGGQKQETQWILDTARPYSEIVLERSRQNGGAWQETRYTHTPDGVGQLISEQRQGKTLHVYEDGQGSARLITDESGQIIETLDFDAFGNEPNPDPASPTRHRYTGESYDSATGLYHLRARDYDPKTGRFISMDEHPGSQSIPLTLNKYLYGNADPVNHIDPSGNFSLGGMMSGIGNMASMMAMSWVRMEVADMFSSALLSPIIEALVPKQGASLVMPKGNLYMNILFEGLATHCMASKRKCYIRKVPLVSHGIELVGHAMHIWASLHGFGNTLSGAGYTSSFLVRGATNHKRGWYNKYYPCNRGVKGDKLSCDEYPFASTLNGGHANYLNDSVSLQLLPQHESDRQRELLGKFYSRANISAGKPFISVANPLVPSYFIDKHGAKHPLF
nr:RHS repeat-associated core domain-containing protein [uncultured Ottowia sp.]